MTAPEADGWDELERLAKAATPGEWRVAEDNNPFADGRHVFAKGFDGADFVVLNLKTDHTFVTATSREQQQKNALFSAAANPSAVLKLIESARRNRGGDEGRQAGVRQDNAGEGDAPVAEQAAKLAAIISDDEVVRVHGHANFGSQSPREVVNDGVRKYAVGYTSGHTQLCILLEHGLITKPRPGRYDASLTKKGKRYARVLFADAFTRPTPATPEGPKPTGEQMVCGNDWQRRMLADAPATPEGLREKVVTAIWDWTRSTTLHLGDIDKVRALADAILAALRPQAEGE